MIQYGGGRRVSSRTLGHDDDIGDAVITGFNTARNSGSVTGASALQIQQDKYKQYTSAVRSRPPPVTRSQLTAFAMDTAGLIAPDGVAMIKKIGDLAIARKPSRPYGWAWPNRPGLSRKDFAE